MTFECLLIGTTDEQTDSVSMPVSYQRTVVRRRTDLVPTIPSPRDTSSSHLHGSRGSLSQHHGRSSGAGRAYSMTRLDQLAKPRTPRLSLLSPTSPPNQPTSPKGKSTKGNRSRSMMHLAGAGLSVPGHQSRQMTRKVHAAKSMTQLAVAGNGPLPPPRMTRAERLRRQSKESAVNNGPQTAVIANGSSSPGQYFCVK